jgi:3-methyladenine DNA glycosylase AlkC
MDLIAVDQPALFASLFPHLAPQKNLLASPRLLGRMSAGGEILWQEFGQTLWSKSKAWTSDVARGWAAMAVGCVPGLPLPRRLRLARKFAGDPHWAVREWAWLGVRNHIVEEPLAALRCLTPWAGSGSPYVRRFASEATRPIGVWSKHIAILKGDPSPAIPMLSALWNDPSRYVRLSVGNWLNDASKTQPDWVVRLCAKLPQSDNSDEIRRRALRTLRRKGN